MQKVGALQQALAKRTEVILSQEDSPRAAMRELEASAESGGLVTDSTHLEYDSPEDFARYLWVENPLAVEWLNERTTPPTRLKPTLMVTEMADLHDILGS